MLKESQHIEFKPNFNEGVIETLVAFANTKGEKVLVGVDDKGKPIKNGWCFKKYAIINI
jgi:predicted HTH transcriptional regulator